MICTSKKALREEAERLHADEILGRKSNIYNYENARAELCKELGATYEGVAYSGGTYGNTGRLDEIVKFDPKTDRWEHIKFIFYTE